VGPKEDYSFRGGSMRTSPPASVDGVVISGGNGRPLQQGAVMMVYGLAPDKFNANKLFNIFCLYGNVVRVYIYAIYDLLEFYKLRLDSYR